jgi:acid phosphatase
MRAIKKRFLLVFMFFVLLAGLAATCTFSRPEDADLNDAKNGRQEHVVKNHKPTPGFSIPNKTRGENYLYFMAIGDQGMGDSSQQRVAFLMNEKAGRDSAHFVITLGDNFYPRGVTSVFDVQWFDKFEGMYDLPNLQIPFYPSLGNHDYRDGNARHQVEYSQKNGKWRMPDFYYTFTKSIDGASFIQFFALNTFVIVTRTNGEYDLAQVEWLERELRASAAIWKVVYGHHPVFSYGKHGDERQMIKLVRPLLEKYDVDLYISGHDHDRQLLGPVSGVCYIVSGTGSKSRDTRYGKKTVFAETNLGFTWFRVSALELHVQFINGDGKIEYAHTWSKERLSGAVRKFSLRIGE